MKQKTLKKNKVENGTKRVERQNKFALKKVKIQIFPH